MHANECKKCDWILERSVKDSYLSKLELNYKNLLVVDYSVEFLLYFRSLNTSFKIAHAEHLSSIDLAEYLWTNEKTTDRLHRSN